MEIGRCTCQEIKADDGTTALPCVAQITQEDLLCDESRAGCAFIQLTVNIEPTGRRVSEMTDVCHVTQATADALAAGGMYDGRGEEVFWKRMLRAQA